MLVALFVALVLLAACQSEPVDSADPGVQFAEVSCPLDEPMEIPGLYAAYQLERAPMTVQVWGCADLEYGPTCINIDYYAVTGRNVIAVDPDVCEMYDYLQVAWTY